MRSGKELILATKIYTQENRLRSWVETIGTLILLILAFSSTFLNIPVLLRLIGSIVCALLYVRMFVIYHDYQHHAILQNSRPASIIMVLFGIYLLTPQNIWKRSHDHHHNHNSKLSLSGIGSYPTISKSRYLGLTRKEQLIYLLNRHPLTIFLGYFSLFIYWLNIKSFIQSPKRHLDSLISLLFHFGIGTFIWYNFGLFTFILSWFFPFLLAFAIGSYLFYSQHNFVGAEFRENHDWKYDQAALSSTSFMVMPQPFQYLMGNIGYHHVHHMNSRIPFYRLPEAMDGINELQEVKSTSWNPIEIAKCLNLKLWDEVNKEMIPLNKIHKK